jgi:hypothetical protein
LRKRDRCLDPRVLTGLEREIALGIEAEGSVGQVGRSNAGERIIDNADFRVDEDRTGCHAVEHGVDEAEAAKLIARS